MQTKPGARLFLLGPVLLLAAATTLSAQAPIRLSTHGEPISIASVDGGMSIIASLEAIGEAFDIDVAFDPGFRDQQVKLALRDVGPEEAFERASAVAGLIWVALDERSVLFAEDTPQNRRKYEPQVVQTFYLENVAPRDALTLLRSVIGVRSVVAVEDLNALTVRDTAPRVALARRLLEQHDRAPAMLEVDVRLVQLSAGELEKALGGDAPPSRLTADRGRALEAAGRLLAQPTLSFADGGQAQIKIGRGAGSDERAAFELTLSGRLAAAEPAVTLEACVEGDSAGESTSKPERRSLTSTLRLEPGETWVFAGLLRAAGADRDMPDHLVVLLTPRVAAASTVQAADREPLAVGTEANLGLESDD